MSKVKSFLLAAIFALTAFFIISCASLEGIGDFSKKGIESVSQGIGSLSQKGKESISQGITNFSQRPNFSKAKRLDKQASERRQKYGDEDEETLNLYTKAIDEYKKCITVNNTNTGEAYHNLGKILYTGPKSLRDYSEAAQRYTAWAIIAHLSIILLKRLGFQMNTRYTKRDFIGWDWA